MCEDGRRNSKLYLALPIYFRASLHYKKYFRSIVLYTRASLVKIEVVNLMRRSSSRVHVFSRIEQEYNTRVEIGLKKHKILNKTSQTKVAPTAGITRYKDAKIGKPNFSFRKNAISLRKDDFTVNPNALWDTYAYSI